MHNDYADIRSRISEPPVWFDEHAVPRWGDFSPRACADIYADEAVLALIACQNCRQRFAVAFTRSEMDRMIAPSISRLAELIRTNGLAYGDPPNVGCCAAGPTMSSDPIVVLQYWSRHSAAFVGDNGLLLDVEGYITWQRDHSLEVALDDPR